MWKIIKMGGVCFVFSNWNYRSTSWLNVEILSSLELHRPLLQGPQLRFMTSKLFAFGWPKIWHIFCRDPSKSTISSFYGITSVHGMDQTYGLCFEMAYVLQETSMVCLKIIFRQSNLCLLCKAKQMCFVILLSNLYFICSASLHIKLACINKVARSVEQRPRRYTWDKC